MKMEVGRRTEGFIDCKLTLESVTYNIYHKYLDLSGGESAGEEIH